MHKSKLIPLDVLILCLHHKDDGVNKVPSVVFEKLNGITRRLASSEGETAFVFQLTRVKEIVFSCILISAT